jgi:predicted nucleic acid-binding protein
LGKFQTLYFDPQSLAIVEQIKRQSKARKRYADVLLAALTLAGRHTLVTWNTADFRDLVPPAQLQNWIDDDIR